MKKTKILIRAGLSPLEYYNVRDICRNNRLGNNVGNLLYAYSLFRHLMVDEKTEIIPDYYRPENNLVKDDEVDRINQEIDYYIIPMADAFRKDFEKHLRNLTVFIRKLHIPAVLVGVGATTRLEGEGRSAVASEEAVTDFLKAVLEHSACLGLRGEYTLHFLKGQGLGGQDAGGFLKDLGLREETDMTPIGCPSVYAFGPWLEVREPDLSSGAKWIFTNNIYASDAVHRFLRDLAKEHDNYLFIPQRLEELEMLYFGKNLDISRFPKNKPAYPVSLSDSFYAGGKAVFPLSVPEWLSIAGQASFSVGPRLHGSIACILAGVPALMIARDQRMREVAAYHRFPCLLQTELAGKMDRKYGIAEEAGLLGAPGENGISDMEMTGAAGMLKEIVCKMDFQAYREAVESNFSHYLNFLEKNGIRHISRDQMAPDQAPLDHLMKKTRHIKSVEPYESISAMEKLHRQIPDPKSLGASLKKRLS